MEGQACEAEKGMAHDMMVVLGGEAVVGLGYKAVAETMDY